ncbi:hypothetical protein KCU67_g25, partial [Aureobasidium melanogenum]
MLVLFRVFSPMYVFDELACRRLTLLQAAEDVLCSSCIGHPSPGTFQVYNQHRRDLHPPWYSGSRGDASCGSTFEINMVSKLPR